MRILGLDTTGAYCTASLVDGASTRSHCSEHIGRGHAERLAPMVYDGLRAAEWEPHDIERISVCTGPGSFTGLRVALAFAQGLALPRNIQMIGLSALDVMAAEADPHGRHNVAAICNVRRGEVCWGVYTRGIAQGLPRTDTYETARAVIDAQACDLYVGDGAHLLDFAAHIQRVDGPTLAALAADKDPQTYPARPLYSRAPDAKLPGGVLPSS